MRTLKIMTIASLFIAISMTSLTYCIHKRSNEAKHSYQSHIQAQEAKIRTFKDTANHWHAVAQASVVQNKEALRFIVKNDPQLQEIVSGFTTIKKSLKNLEYLGITGLNSKYTSTPTSIKDTLYIANKDTSNAKIIYARDPQGWYSYRAFVANNTIKEISFYTNDSLTTALSWRRRWFLGRKKYEVEIISKNPNTKIHYSRAIVKR